MAEVLLDSPRIPQCLEAILLKKLNDMPSSQNG